MTLADFLKRAVMTNTTINPRTIPLLCRYVDDLMSQRDSLKDQVKSYRSLWQQAQKRADNWQKKYMETTDPQENIRRIYRPDQIGWHILDD